MAVSTWKTPEINTWLDKIGFSKYKDNFASVTGLDLLKVTSQADVKKIANISTFSDRNAIFEKIKLFPPEVIPEVPDTQSKTPEDISTWLRDDIFSWLEKIGKTKYKDIVESTPILGSNLMNIKAAGDLKSVFGITAFSERDDFYKKIVQLQGTNKGPPPKVEKVVETPDVEKTEQKPKAASPKPASPKPASPKPANKKALGAKPKSQEQSNKPYQERPVSSWSETDVQSYMAENGFEKHKDKFTTTDGHDLLFMTLETLKQIGISVFFDRKAIVQKLKTLPQEPGLKPKANMDDVAGWSSDTVMDFIEGSGYEKYKSSFANCTGSELLDLSYDDLKNKYNISVFFDRKDLHKKIQQLPRPAAAKPLPEWEAEDLANWISTTDFSAYTEHAKNSKLTGKQIVSMDPADFPAKVNCTNFGDKKGLVAAFKQLVSEEKAKENKQKAAAAASAKGPTISDAEIKKREEQRRVEKEAKEKAEKEAKLAAEKEEKERKEKEEQEKIEKEKAKQEAIKKEAEEKAQKEIEQKKQEEQKKIDERNSKIASVLLSPGEAAQKKKEENEQKRLSRLVAPEDLQSEPAPVEPPAEPPKAPVDPPKIPPAEPPKVPTEPPKIPPAEPPKIPAEPPKAPVDPPKIPPAEPPKIPAEPPKIPPAEPPKIPPAEPPKIPPAEPPKVPAEPPKIPPAEPPKIPAEPPKIPPAEPPKIPPAEPPKVPAEPPKIPPAEPPKIPAEPPKIPPAEPPKIPPAEPPNIPAEPPKIPPAEPPKSSDVEGEPKNPAGPPKEPPKPKIVIESATNAGEKKEPTDIVEVLEAKNAEPPKEIEPPKEFKMSLPVDSGAGKEASEEQIVAVFRDSTEHKETKTVNALEAQNMFSVLGRYPTIDEILILNVTEFDEKTFVKAFKSQNFACDDNNFLADAFASILGDTTTWKKITSMMQASSFPVATEDLEEIQKTLGTELERFSTKSFVEVLTGKGSELMA